MATYALRGLDPEIIQRAKQLARDAGTHAMRARRSTPCSAPTSSRTPRGTTHPDSSWLRKAAWPAPSPPAGRLPRHRPR